MIASFNEAILNKLLISCVLKTTMLTTSKLGLE